ncbi:MAG: tyrosine-type recombinase/integrase [Nitrospirae bacterium]|nr:tyrosine-type recombinase/integrase [Nitrospirota bacterium]
MLYNHEKNLKATEERIKRSNICEANKQYIFEFENYCFAEGLKIARVLKHLTELKVLAEMIGQDFKTMPKQDMISLVGRIERMDRAERTKQDYKSLIRKFFKWLGREELVEWIKIPLRKDSRKLPEDMLSEEEIEKMINACEHPRDRAMVACLYESGTRISELGGMKIKHVKFDQYGAVLMVDGKTGMRRVRIIFSSPYLATWLDNHPFRQNPEAFVWVGIGTVGRNVPLRYDAIRMHLKRIAAKAGINKRIHPHLFRHSRSTHLAKHLTEAQMKQYLGWVQGSDMAAIYVHLSGRDVDNALLRMHGIVSDETKDVQMSPKQCTRCNTMNAPTTKFCSKCGLALDIKAALEMEEKSSEVTMDFMQVAKNDPKIVDFMKMFLESVSSK